MNARTEMKAHGIKVLLSGHKEVRKLKRKFKPSNHGYKVWQASWLLIDYLKKSEDLHEKNVMDLGCGWGLSGIYCAKHFNASVTCVDMDDDVYPYLNLMATINRVQVDFLNLDMERINRKYLKHTDILIGSDICFCDTLIDPLRRLFKRAEASAIEQIIISDPGRWPFDDLTEYYTRNKKVKVIDWAIRKPSNYAGKILKIDLNKT